MVEHDRHVGLILDKLDELGIADDTIVMYSTDNGPHYNSWPDAAITPFRSEKNSNWEGAYRVPAFLRWPAKWQAGVTLNGIVAHQDMLTTFLAAAGDPDIAAKCRAGHDAAGKTFKVVLDGKDMNAYFAGETDESPRDRFFYVNDDAELVALRVGDWKFIFKEQRAHQLALWLEPFVELRAPKIVNLRRDPFERPSPTPTPTGTGSSTASTWSCPRRGWWPRRYRSSRSSRRARSPRRSTSTACSRSSRRSAAARAEPAARIRHEKVGAPEGEGRAADTMRIGPLRTDLHGRGHL